MDLSNCITDGIKKSMQQLKYVDENSLLMFLMIVTYTELLKKPDTFQLLQTSK